MNTLSHKVVGYIPIDERKLNPQYQYCIINRVEGNCLNSDLCPIRIKDGDKLLVHQIPLTEKDIIENVKKVVCFILNDNRCFVKQLVFWDGLFWGIRVKMFIPKEQTYLISLNDIKTLFVVDEALNPEHVKSW